MALSYKQQRIHFRPMVDRAWRAHCERDNITESTTASKEAWYRDELRKSCGVTTSKDLDPRDGFEVAMAHFEELANDGSFRWQLAQASGDIRRAGRRLQDTMADVGVDQTYVDGIASQMGIQGSYDAWSVKELIKLRLALLYYKQRHP